MPLPAQSVLQLDTRTRIPHGESRSAGSEAARVRARTAAGARRGRTAPIAHEGRLALAASTRRGAGDGLSHRRNPERPVQAASMGSQRAAPVESDDQGTALAVHPAVAGAPGDARTPPA